MNIIIFLILLSALAFYLRKFLGNSFVRHLSSTQQTLIWLGIMVILLLLMTGRLGGIVPVLGAVIGAVIATFTRVIPAIIPVLVRYFPYLRHFYRSYQRQNEGKTRSPGRSDVETPFVSMFLNHETGEIGGRVCSGPLAGRELVDLSIQELSQLYHWLEHQDHESATLVAAYLDRLYGDVWKSDQSTRSDHESPIPSNQEAYEILGLSPGASHDDIIDAHRRLIQKLHPDRGGSDYLAAKINQAKDQLLKSI